MNLFETPGADAAYDRWLNPPDTHELDDCFDCHENGDHEDRRLDWMRVCESCRVEVEKKAANVVIEFKFTADDIDAAMKWAKRNGYRYEKESVEHLVHDAMLAGAIKTDAWSAL